MKIVFFGTPSYVVPVVEALNKTFGSKLNQSGVVAVVTQKPKPTGRKQELEYSPIDTWAFKKKIPIFFDPSDLIRKRISSDIGVLASFGQILQKEIIDYFPEGIINLHPSLLPKFRGASPVQAAIASGESLTGLTFTKMDSSLDKGYLISQFKEEVADNDTTDSLRDRLFLRSSEVIKTLIPAYLSGKIKLKKLSSLPKTFTRQINKEDALIPPDILNLALQGKTQKREWKIAFINNYVTRATPTNLYNFIRAMLPWPVAWTLVRINGKNIRIKILKAHLEAQKLVLDEIQLEGKTPVSWKQFKEGYPKASFAKE